ncbi:MAG: response regulator [Pirellulales bacterium]|nr:response regulator [Pirellulales bacterium]
MDVPIVLLAEDDESHVELLRRAVDRSGIECQVEIVHDGVELIESLFATGKQQERPPLVPDLIFLDLKMPRMTGLQVLQVLRRVRGGLPIRYVPVVVLTSSDQDDDVQEAYRLGAQSYICKPTDFSEFSQAVRDALQYWLCINRSLPRHRLASHALRASNQPGAYL